MEYLLFRLYGPLASWGEIAVGESRHSASYPGKSALVGLLAAALGIRRDEEERQLALSISYQFGVKVVSTGHLLRDYHTTQSAPKIAVDRYRPATRKDELAALRAYRAEVANYSGTILSSREYRCDALSVIAVRALDQPPFYLRDLRDALLEPKFCLYLGRKSCPLAAPLNPLVREAKGFGQVLDEYPQGPLYLSSYQMRTARKEAGVGRPVSGASILAGLSKDDQYLLSITEQQVRYYWEGEAGDLEPQQVLTRYDQPISRKRWQFTQRAEQLFVTKEGQ
jgi:CRISPR system Cascade subunit CasD